MGPGVRHGSGEPGSALGNSGEARRERERDRDRSMSRSRKMGPEETKDWDVLVDKIHSRLETLERNQRQHAVKSAALSN